VIRSHPILKKGTKKSPRKGERGKGNNPKSPWEKTKKKKYPPPKKRERNELKGQKREMFSARIRKKVKGYSQEKEGNERLP